MRTESFLDSKGSGMSKSGVVVALATVAFLFTIVSTVRADTVHMAPGLDKIEIEGSHTLDLPDLDKPDVNFVLSEHFSNNNGRHLGFSVAAFHGGMQFGLSHAPQTVPVSVTQNPEPTGMLLLGTGLAAGAAFARCRRRHS